MFMVSVKKNINNNNKTTDTKISIYIFTEKFSKDV